jgi:two-component system LytT family response regulator
MKLRIVTVDDEPLARDRLRRLLSKEPDIEIVAECADGSAAIEAVRRHSPDVLLLDVQMPGMDGFEVVRALGDIDKPPALVFVTAYDQHAVRAFEARAIDYLLKPTRQARLHEALQRARERLIDQGRETIPQALLDLLAERDAAANRLRRIAVRNGERVTFVVTEQIDWIEAAGNYVLLHAGKENHIVRETLTALEAQLPDAFFRVSRSAILNLRRIRELQSVTSGEYVAILVDAQRIPITRTIREVEERLRFL